MTPDMTHRLAPALGTSAEGWRRLQNSVDRWEAERAAGATYARLERVTTTPPAVAG